MISTGSSTPTKTEIEAILNGLDGLVTAEFDKGEAQARGEFTAKHKADMEKYKDKRYSGAGRLDPLG